MKLAWLSLLMVIASAAAAVLAWPYVPERVATHWGISGMANGYGPKWVALLLLPIISAVLLPLLHFIPRIDPMKKNIDKFRGQYDALIAAIMGFLLYIQLLTVAWNVWFQFNMSQAMAPGFALLFWVCGLAISKAKRNYFIGIRTPWTLSSDRVWEKTHKLGGKLFRAAALFCLAGILLPDYAIFFMIVPVIFAAAYSVVYSYVEYSKG